MAIKAHFTAEHCRCITWAIIDNGRSYFDNVKTTLDFKTGMSIVFPQSFLVVIIRNVRYGILAARANYPDEWPSKKRTITQDQGQQISCSTPGTGSPGIRGNDRQTQCPPGSGYDQYRGRGYQGSGAQGGGYGGGYYQPNNYQPRNWHANWHDE